MGQKTNDAVLFPRFRSDHDGNMIRLFLAGTVLARRYKILERTDGDSFKAHDLALDQTVTVRQAMPTSPRDGDAWRQKVRQLILVRHPAFLNVLDVIFDESIGFVITERARGRSIGELLRERSRFDLEDVLRLMTPLAGSLDLAATLTSCPNPISACWLLIETRRSFAVDAKQSPLSGWPPFFVKLDVWELVTAQQRPCTADPIARCDDSFQQADPDGRTREVFLDAQIQTCIVHLIRSLRQMRIPVANIKATHLCILCLPRRAELAAC